VEELFTALGCHRDRALMAFYLSSGARPGELLTVTNQLVDPGNQVVGVVRKGSRAVQSLPASPDAFVWLRLYQAELPAECLAPAAPVWWTRRRPRRPLGYGAARAVFIRVNAVLGTNWTLHDLRHTAATRMASDPGMPLVDIQHILGHAWLTTTQIYLHPHERDVLEHAHAHFERLRSRQREERTSPRPGELPGGQGAHLAYDAADLKELFGGDA
jgi:site-specific recombinase XerD